MTEEEHRQQTGNQPVGPEAGADAPAEAGQERAEPVTPDTTGGSLTIRDDYFETVSNELQRAYPAASEAIVRTVVDLGELTFHVRPDHLGAVARVLRDDEALRFELLSSLSGVHYPGDIGAELHVVYQLTSLTHRRLIRLEVAVPDADPHVPSVVAVWPTADFQEREVWDMFGVIFDGHPALTRILMPDDWPGHPQRKDYPLGGVAVQYKGAKVPPPDERRAYA